jgi:uncharacterized Fe-S center protein
MVTAAAANTGTCLDVHEYGKLQGTDKFAMLHPKTNWKGGLAYAEKIGLGSTEYELVTL